MAISLKYSLNVNVNATSLTPSVGTIAVNDVVIITLSASGTPNFSVTNNAGATFTWSNPVHAVGAAPIVEVWYGVWASGTGSTTVKITSSSTSGSAVLSVFSGISNSSTLVQSNTSSQATQTTSSTTALTSSDGKQNLLYGGTSHYGATYAVASWSSGDSTTQIGFSNYNSRPAAADYIIASTTSTETLSYTYSNSQVGGTALLEFRAATYTNTITANYFLTPTQSSILSGNYSIKGQRGGISSGGVG